MILFTIIMIMILSSMFRPRPYFWYGPRYYRPRPMFGFGHMMRGPRPMGGPMGRGPHMHGPMGGPRR